MGALADLFVQECKRRLLETKRQLLNRLRINRTEFQALDKSGGDEGDQTMQLIAENDFLTTQGRMKNHLLEVEFALARIENGTYGFCEETNEQIEFERLRAIPWTRLSLEGAEIREATGRKFAR